MKLEVGILAVVGGGGGLVRRDNVGQIVEKCRAKRKE
jgi:hypothetical protein